MSRLISSPARRAALVLGIACGWLVPQLAGASPLVVITINDLGEGPTFSTAGGFDPATISVQNNDEKYDIHGEYLSSANPLPAGGVAVANFNLFDPAAEGGGLSDTLSVVFTGHAPDAADSNNVTVDLHFASESEPGGNLMPLGNAFALIETGNFQDLSGYITAAGGPGDFQLLVASDVESVPLPRTALAGVVLMGVLGGTVALRSRKIAIG